MASQTNQGILVVVVLKARNLNDKHSFYKQDVFAQATLNGIAKRTHVDQKGGQHPVWDDEIRFPVFKDSGDKHRKLEIACYAKERKNEDILGSAVIDISDVIQTREFDEWVNLGINGVSRGEVYLEMTYFPSTGNTLPVSGINPENYKPNRRPSKLMQTERLSRPGHSSVPAEASVPPARMGASIPSTLAPGRGSRPSNPVHVPSMLRPGNPKSSPRPLAPSVGGKEPKFGPIQNESSTNYQSHPRTAPISFPSPVVHGLDSSARYQHAPPLPPRSAHGENSSYNNADADHLLAVELAKENERFEEQEEKDRQLALQLDRELNAVDEQSRAPTQNTGRMPGAWQ